MYVNNMLEVPEVTVPRVIGMTEEDAIRTLEGEGLTVDPEVIREYKPNVVEGEVFDQSKPEGTKVKKDSPIQLSVGAAKPLEKMPNLSGQTYDQAVEALTALGIDPKAINKDEQNHDEIEAGMIISQNPSPDADIDPDKVAVSLVVSKGKKFVKMPALVGMTEEQARDAIESRGLVVEAVKQKPSFEVKQGIVMEQWPHEANDEIPPGEKITIFVSSGYPPEALEYNYSVPITPAYEGQESKIRIVFSDALGDNQEAVNKTITTLEWVSVKLLLAPDKHATVQIFQDGRQVETYSVSYSDVKNGTVPQPTMEQPPLPPDMQVDTNPDEGTEGTDGTDGGEEGSDAEDDSAYEWDPGNGNGNGHGRGKGNE